MTAFRFFALLCAVLAASFVSCSDNPADGPSDEHVEAFGLVIYDSGAEIARYQNGVVQGVIEVDVHQETPLLTVRFLDEGGTVIDPGSLTGSEYSLQWTVGNTAVAEVEHHDDDGRWSFHIAGIQEGETTLKIMLYHNDHADFTSKEIPIHVEPGITGMKLLLNGSQVLTANTEAVTGVFTMANGTTGNVQLQFTDQKDSVIALEDHHHVEVVPDDTSFIDVTTGQPNGTFAFTARKAGVTSFRVRLSKEEEHGHGGEEHVLYESPAIVLSIED